MSQEEVYNWFTLYFPQFAKHVTEWFPNGRNSVESDKQMVRISCSPTAVKLTGASRLWNLLLER